MREININSIHGGVSQTLNQGESNSYIGACGINPDAKIGERISGSISPTSYQKFNDLKDVLWFEPNDVNSNIYFYTKDGKFGYISNTNVVTVISTLTNASGNGLKYYNNYYYIATNNDIHRYGPMNGTPTLEENWWTGVTFLEKVFEIDSRTDVNRIHFQHSMYRAIAQSIQEEENITFRYVELLMSRLTTNDGDFELNVSLTNDNAGSPGTVISTTTINSSEILKKAESTFETDFEKYTSIAIDLGEQTLTANTKYWITVEQGTGFRTDDSDLVLFLVEVGNKYSNGVWKSKYQGGDWGTTQIGGKTADMFLALHASKPTSLLGNEKYKTVGAYKMPNHAMFLHSNNAVYFVDYKGGMGQINRIETGSSILVDDVYGFAVGDVITGKTSNARATILSINTIVPSQFTTSPRKGELVLVSIYNEFQEGEVIVNISNHEANALTALRLGYSNTNSDENLVQLTSGLKPIAISNYGYDLGIIAYKGNEARMLLWDTLAYAPYRSIGLPYNLASAIHTHNGDLFVFGGKDRMTIGRYIGGETIEEVFHCDHSLLPLQGAVKSNNGRILIGTKQTYPEERGCIWSYGTIATMPDRLHPIISNPTQITAISDDYSSSDGLYKEATSGYNSIFRSQVYNFSQPFTIKEINLSLSDNNKTGVKAILHYDNDRITDEHTIVLEENSRNFVIYPEHRGTTNFYLEILIKGEDFVSVNLPIRIAYEY